MLDSRRRRAASAMRVARGAARPEDGDAAEIERRLITRSWQAAAVIVAVLAAAAAALFIGVPLPVRLVAAVQLVGLLALVGAAGGAVNSSSGRAVMYWFGPEERGLALGVRQTAIPLGGLVGAAGIAAIGLAPTLLVGAGVYLVATLTPALRPEWAQMDADRRRAATARSVTTP
jgi:MFS family permease